MSKQFQSQTQFRQQRLQSAEVHDHQFGPESPAARTARPHVHFQALASDSCATTCRSPKANKCFLSVNQGFASDMNTSLHDRTPNIKALAYARSLAPLPRQRYVFHSNTTAGAPFVRRYFPAATSPALVDRESCGPATVMAEDTFNAKDGLKRFPQSKLRAESTTYVRSKPPGKWSTFVPSPCSCSLATPGTSSSMNTLARGRSPGQLCSALPRYSDRPFVNTQPRCSYIYDRPRTWGNLHSSLPTRVHGSADRTTNVQDGSHRVQHGATPHSIYRFSTAPLSSYHADLRPNDGGHLYAKPLARSRASCQLHSALPRYSGGVVMDTQPRYSFDRPRTLGNFRSSLPIRAQGADRSNNQGVTPHEIYRFSTAPLPQYRPDLRQSQGRHSYANTLASSRASCQLHSALPRYSGGAVMDTQPRCPYHRPRTLGNFRSSIPIRVQGAADRTTNVQVGSRSVQHGATPGKI